MQYMRALRRIIATEYEVEVAAVQVRRKAMWSGQRGKMMRQSRHQSVLAGAGVALMCAVLSIAAAPRAVADDAEIQPSKGAVIAETFVLILDILSPSQILTMEGHSGSCRYSGRASCPYHYDSPCDRHSNYPTIIKKGLSIADRSKRGAVWKNVV